MQRKTKQGRNREKEQARIQVYKDDRRARRTNKTFRGQPEPEGFNTGRVELRRRTRHQQPGIYQGA